MSTRILTLIMAALLALYIVFVAQRAVLLVMTGEPVGVVMGVALIVLPVIAAWALWRELAFGASASRLGRRLEQESALPEESIDLSPSGRPDRIEADALFPRYREAVEEAPEDWRAWFRLGLAYDGAGDRRRARQAVRTAISLERAERRV
ncbi:tetratricopeptide repeat protein [Microbacterium arborescens]|uniref:tetratricopeptide repeat protein n=1 Tax=Microbacterium arborescens TaxID=33883 RepID=UPI0027852929|nr:tetratricopeptide repeat protein [Microbacterium arborescens]MDQ1216795.1 cytochrome c-type biogenesis protein CcmH/NrfG [Microbacterium arborescens]